LLLVAFSRSCGLLFYLVYVLQSLSVVCVNCAMSTSHRHCVALFTGCWYHSASPSRLRWWCSTVLAADVRSTLVHSYTHCCYLFVIAISRPRWHCHPTRTIHSVWLPQVPRMRSADRQFGTNFYRICEAQTLGSSLNIGLRTCYLSVHTTGGESDW